MIRTHLLLTVSQANTELSLELPELRRMRVRRANTWESRFSFVPDKVLAGTESTIVVPDGEWFDSRWMRKDAGPIYFMGYQPAAAFFLQVWTPGVITISSAFTFGFSLGFES